ncbi:Rpn family recombination-promoting nuclease/putative transposase [Desulfothermus naphthae]
MDKKYIQNPHDVFVKEVFSHKEQAEDFLKNYLPQNICKLIDFDSLTIVKDSFVDENLKTHFSDLLYEVQISSRDGFIYLLFEHKSIPQRFTALQLLRYMVKIWDLYLKQNQSSTLPVIIPLVIYNGHRKWTIKTNFSDLFGEIEKELDIYIPDFNYLLYDLSTISDEEIKGKVILQATLMALKYLTTPEPGKYLKRIFSLFKDLGESNTPLQYLETLLSYIASASDKIDEKDITEAIKQIKKEANIMPTLAEKWIEQGRIEGRMEGRIEGRIEGQREGRMEGMILDAQEMVLEALIERFGLIKPDLSVKIKGIVNREVLKSLLKLAIRVESLSEFEEKLKQVEL